MKKRSLFAAVAMLIVSAMVLTSATYAWFASGGNAAIEAWSTNTCEAGTGVQLKTTATSAKWKNTLTSSDFGQTGSTDAISSEYHPVSSADGAAFKAYTIETGDAFTEVTSTITGYYSTYYFYVGTIASGDSVDATLTIGGTAAAAARVAVFEGSTLKGIYAGDTEGSYKAVTGSLTNVTDDNQDAIINDDESATGLTAPTTTVVTANSTNPQTITLTTPGQVGAASNTLVKVVVWLEGNDSSCKAVDVAGKTISTQWAFSVSA